MSKTQSKNSSMIDPGYGGKVGKRSRPPVQLTQKIAAPVSLSVTSVPSVIGIVQAEL